MIAWMRSCDKKFRVFASQEKSSGLKFRVRNSGFRVEQPLMDPRFWILDELIADCELWIADLTAYAG